MTIDTKHQVLYALYSEYQKDIPYVYEILKKGSEKAEAVAEKTLQEVKASMKINYFNDQELIAAQAEKFREE